MSTDLVAGGGDPSLADCVIGGGDNDHNNNNNSHNDNSMKALWMPFTPNKLFKSSNKPRVLAKAKGMYYWTTDGRQILDGTAGLWCSNAGHCPDSIVDATQKQLATLDFSPSFLFSHPKAFEYATRLVNEIAPPNSGLDHLFFTMCGSW